MNAVGFNVSMLANDLILPIESEMLAEEFDIEKNNSLTENNIAKTIADL